MFIKVYDWKIFLCSVPAYVIFYLGFLHLIMFIIPCWISIFLEDILNLKVSNEDVYESLSKGHFTVRKTNRNFSCMGIDQAHKQNNKNVKTDSIAIGILTNDSGFLKWAVVGPIIADMLVLKKETRTGKFFAP